MPRSKKQGEGRAVLEGRQKGINTGLHSVFCNGRFVVGPDWKNLLGSTFLIVAPAGIFFGFEANAVGTSTSWAVVAVVGFLTLLSLALLYCTAFVEPGFIPRQPEHCQPDDGAVSKEYEVNGYTVQTKWCSTCNHYRPPRCSHCAVCDNCVAKFDHHCPWVGTCVGERNYPFFLAFLLATTALDCVVFAFTWVRIVYLVSHDGKTWWQAIQHEPANLALMIYTFLLFFFVGGLASMHIYFTTMNVTTYEHFRSRYSEAGNPYDKGFFRNWAAVFCTKQPKIIKETLPFREVQSDGLYAEPSPMSASYSHSNGNNANGFSYRQQPSVISREDENTEIQMREMEEGRHPLEAETRSALSSLDGSSITDDDRSVSRVSQRRIPLVGGLEYQNAELLDTNDSDFSMADQIRSHHSVVRIHDVDSAESTVSRPSISGERFSNSFEKGSSSSQPVYAEYDPEIPTETSQTWTGAPSGSQNGVGPSTTGTSSQVGPVHGQIGNTANERHDLSLSPQGPHPSSFPGSQPSQSPGHPIHSLNAHNGVAPSEPNPGGITQNKHSETEGPSAGIGEIAAGILSPETLATRSGSLPEQKSPRDESAGNSARMGNNNIAGVNGVPPENGRERNGIQNAAEQAILSQQDGRLISGFSALPPLAGSRSIEAMEEGLAGPEIDGIREVGRDFSDDETFYGSPRAMSVWPSTDIESFKTAASGTGDIDGGSWGGTSRASSRSLGGTSWRPAAQRSVDAPVHRKTEP